MAHDHRRYVFVRFLLRLFWGKFCVVAALLFANLGKATRQTTLVLIHAVGSLLYGPILAAFLLGMLTKWARPKAVKLGVAAGILANLVLWLFTPISWLWWNLTGFSAAVVLAYLLSFFDGHEESDIRSHIESIYEKDPSKINWPRIYKFVVLYFFLIILVCYLIQKTG